MNIADVVKGLATLSWLVIIGIIILAVIRASRGRPIKRVTSLIIGLAVIAVVLTVVGAGLVFLQPEELGVVITPYDPQGYRSVSLGPGLHWIIPGETVKVYTRSRQTYTMSIAPGEGQIAGDDSILARTRDGQEVTVDASVIYNIDPEKVVQLQITWQDRYQDAVVRPLARGTIRDVVSQYGVEEVVSTKRSEMVQRINDELAAGLTQNNLILVDFILRDISFSAEYAAAVEQKQIAEQQALQAQYIVEQRRQEAEQARQVAQGQADAAVIQAKGAAQARTIQAEAEAKALELINAALSGHPELLTYQYITKLSPEIQVMLLPNNSPFLFPLPEIQAK